MERVIGRLLRFGVMFSSAIVLFGAICLLYQHGGERVRFGDFQPAAPEYRSVSGTFHAAAGLDCRAIIQLGLLFLIATPMARVAFSLAAFAEERDRIYVSVTFVVLAILISSFLFER
jgi:uncharacterized membrane protein